MLALKSPQTNDVCPWAVNQEGVHLYMLAVKTFNYKAHRGNGATNTEFPMGGHL